ncbi:hypothetical protein [Bradyrhizobium pachyrhizi]|uniref:hypothetical protein n=1 Tax=Bradyrhizobium pachyrhizi TaxID=280333 RepID=UPI003221B219
MQSQYATTVALSPQKVDLLDVDPASLSRLKRPCVLDDPAACDETLRRIAEVPAAWSNDAWLSFRDCLGQIGIHFVTLAATFALAVPIGWDRKKRTRSAGCALFR